MNLFHGRKVMVVKIGKRKSLKRSKLHLFVLLGLEVRAVGSVIITLDLLDGLVDGPGLGLPLLLGHLDVLLEHPVLGHSVSAAHAVKGSKELAVVDLESRVVQRVTGGAVDDRVVGEVLAVVDHDGPEVDKDEEEDVGHLLQREDEGEDVIRDGLGEAVDGVEGMAGVGRGHDPLVVRLVQALVDGGVVEAAVNPVDEEVGEDEEERELEEVVPQAGALLGDIVELAVAADLEQEEGRRHQGHEGHGLVGVDNLEPDLVLEVLGVVHDALVEDEEEGQGSKDEVDDEAEDPGDEEEGRSLAVNVVARHGAHVGSLAGLELNVLRRRLVGPRREGLGRRIGSSVGEVVERRLQREEIGVDMVGDEGVGDFEHDIHGGREWKGGTPRLEVDQRDTQEEEEEE